MVRSSRQGLHVYAIHFLLRESIFSAHLFRYCRKCEFSEEMKCIFSIHNDVVFELGIGQDFLDAALG